MGTFFWYKFGKMSLLQSDNLDLFEHNNPYISLVFSKAQNCTTDLFTDECVIITMVDIWAASSFSLGHCDITTDNHETIVTFAIFHLNKD